MSEKKISRLLKVKTGLPMTILKFKGERIDKMEITHKARRNSHVNSDKHKCLYKRVEVAYKPISKIY